MTQESLSGAKAAQVLGRQSTTAAGSLETVIPITSSNKAKLFHSEGPRF